MRMLRGFTLIELIVAVTVIAILAAVAIPSYSQYVLRANRAAAATVLLETAGALERSYTTTGCYHRDTVTRCQDGTGSVAPPLARSQAPAEGAAKYTIAAPTRDSQAFVLTATPTGGFTDPVCGILRLRSNGAREVDVAGTVYTQASDPTRINTCWQR